MTKGRRVEGKKGKVVRRRPSFVVRRPSSSSVVTMVLGQLRARFVNDLGLIAGSIAGPIVSAHGSAAAPAATYSEGARLGPIVQG